MNWLGHPLTLSQFPRVPWLMTNSSLHLLGTQFDFSSEVIPHVVIYYALRSPVSNEGNK